MACWLLCCVVVLVFALSSYAPGPRSDAMVPFAWAMLALSFPFGLVVSLALSVLLSVVDQASFSSQLTVPSSVGIPAVWALFCIAGYFQWFVLAPRLIGRLRGRKETGTSPSKLGNANDA